MTSYADHFTAHLRLTILRLLEATPARRLNASLLRDAADAYGITATRDQIATEISWLQEQGLVTTENLGGLIVATLRDRGIEVACGRAVTPGVRRPSSGD